ncbi:RND superfamily putative drug exporter [Thermocatellispora tengchongensis]|uniref:RND superfamily putative drug exporter n=1 Tax=Thermocatellispora tengchongensis TaxID=1073253 RepID=A0A840PLT7_9ACTN|nr:MMPL family transporter [Thermocatellispora tengchongensis]MBB5138600.1 RND superfamily putative drug exporter [Thermocatellispora tengchongensis]
MFVVLGRFVRERRRLVLVATAVLTVLAGVWGAGVFSALGGGGYDNPASEAARAAALIEREFGRQDAVDAVVVYRAQGGDLKVDDPAFADVVNAALGAIPPSRVSEVVSYWTPGLTAGKRAELVSRDRTATAVELTVAGETEAERLANFQAVSGALRVEGLDTYLGGGLAGLDQLNTAAASDLTRAELIAMPVLIVLLIVLLRGVVAGLLPLLTGVIAILGAMALLRAVTYVTDVSIFALNIATLLGLGLAIDYGLFVVNRFREELARGRDVPDALTKTVATAGPTVAFSGVLIAIAFSGMLFFPTAALRSIGWGGIAIVLVDVLAALVVLPALLAVLGRRVDALRLPGRRTAAAGGRWAGIAAVVMRRPLAWLLAVGAVLLVAGAPLASLQPGTVNHRYLPPGSDDLMVVKILDEEFASRGKYYVDVAVSGDVARTELDRYAADLARLPGAFGAEVFRTSGDVGHVRVGVIGEPDTDVNLQLVREIRALPEPRGAGEVLVGGQPAATVDNVEALVTSAPLALLFVAALTFVVLFCAFGSLILPIKALLAAFLSLGASAGVMIWGIQDGALAPLLGFTPAGTTDLGNLMIVLLIIFGLATDYELFLVSRIREEYLATGDNARSVATGLQRTGSIITSAAVLLGVVLATMGLTSSGLVLTTIGVGMTVALVVDATLVRTILVPATMRLLGDRNWWLPSPLRRLHDRVGLSEEDHSDPAPAPAR